MDHWEYIERYLSAHADDELNADENEAVSAHLATCAECRETLAVERATKAMIQTRVRVIPAPDALRRRIVAALDAVDENEPRLRLVARRKTFVRRPAFWMAAVSLAASLILLTLNFGIYQPANRTFDAAIASYVKSEKSFVPTIGSNDQLAEALINQFGVPLVWDFSSIGLAPVGGRIDHADNGKVVAYSMYKGHTGSLLCIIDRHEGFHFPAGGQIVKGIHIYKYKGYSIAATDRYAAVFCVMVTRLPDTDLARAFDQLPG
jgi:anti-sigma factor (TIGR02949 family)